MLQESYHLWLRYNLWRRDSPPGPSWPTSQQCSHSRTAPVVIMPPRTGQSGRGTRTRGVRVPGFQGSIVQGSRVQLAPEIETSFETSQVIADFVEVSYNGGTTKPSIPHREALESRSEGIVFLAQQNMTPNPNL